jgi:hypothetical protein
MPYDPPWGGWIIAEIGRNVVAGMRGRNSGRTSRILIRRGHRSAPVQFAIISRFNAAGLGQGGAGDLHRQAVRGGVHPRPTSVTIMQVTAARGWTVGSLIYPSRQIPPSAWSCKRAWARSFARCEISYASHFGLHADMDAGPGSAAAHRGEQSSGGGFPANRSLVQSSTAWVLAWAARPWPMFGINRMRTLLPAPHSAAA